MFAIDCKENLEIAKRRVLESVQPGIVQFVEPMGDPGLIFLRSRQLDAVLLLDRRRRDRVLCHAK